MKDKDDDDFKNSAQDWQERSLEPLKEDLALWLTEVLDTEITTETFMSALSNGVLLCQLACLIQKNATQWKESGRNLEAESYKIKFNTKAREGSFTARDNVANFIHWCTLWSIPTTCLFESDDLVLQKNLRNVIVCLYEVGRVAQKIGMEPPALLKLDSEIQKEEEAMQNTESEVHVEDTDSCGISPPSSPVSKSSSMAFSDETDCSEKDALITLSVEIEKPPVKKDSLSAKPVLTAKKSFPSYDRPRHNNLKPMGALITNNNVGKNKSAGRSRSKTPTQLVTPRPRLKKCDHHKSIHCECHLKRAEEKINRNARVKTPEKCLDLDDEIERLLQKRGCKDVFKIHKLSEGQYLINGRKTFIRVLRGKHVMVRVGGGWQSFEEYIIKHDPRNTVAMSHQGQKLSEIPDNSQGYLAIQSKYRVTPAVT